MINSQGGPVRITVPLAFARVAVAFGLTLLALLLLAGPAVAAVDTDSDGFSDEAEIFMGTDPTRACGETTLPNDEQTDAWPPDLDDDARVGISDIIAMRAAYGSVSGDGTYTPRLDFTVDGRIDIDDMLILRAFYDETCSPSQPLPTGAFLETFDGEPAAPQSAYQYPGFDTVIEVRDGDPYAAHEMEAAHTPACGSPLVQTHTVQDFDDQIFQCRNHLMTAINGPQGQVFFSPPALVDFRNGPAKIRWDSSSTVTSNRDWQTVWIQEWGKHVANPQAQGAINGIGWFATGHHAEVYTNGSRQDKSGIKAPKRAVSDLGLGTSWVRRDTYEITISRTGYTLDLITGVGTQRLMDFSLNLSWDVGVVQFGHQTYSPQKGTTNDAGCNDIPVTCPTANTWHWDNVGIEPALPMTIIHGPRAVEGSGTHRIDFHKPLSRDGWVRGVLFSPGNVEISLDGTNFVPAQIQQKGKTDNDLFTLWHTVPAGTQSIWIRQGNGAFDGVDWILVTGGQDDQVSTAWIPTNTNLTATYAEMKEAEPTAFNCSFDPADRLSVALVKSRFEG